MPSDRETGLLQKCGRIGCEWSAWLDYAKGDPYSATERGRAAYLGHVATEHPTLYPEVRELFKNTLAAEERKREAAIREEAIEARRRLVRSAEAAKIKVCKDHHHVGQEFMDGFSDGWQCQGCGQPVTTEDLVALGGEITSDGHVRFTYS